MPEADTPHHAVHAPGAAMEEDGAGQGQHGGSNEEDGNELAAAEEEEEEDTLAADQQGSGKSYSWERAEPPWNSSTPWRKR